MRKWAVTGHVTISITTVVEARSAAGAKRLAAQRTISSVHIPVDADQSAEWVPGEEMDGAPTVIDAEELVED